MEIKVIDQDFSICKPENLSQIKWEEDYFFIGKTDEELSLVCSTESVSDNTLSRDDGWKAFRIQGVLDFSLIGILSRITTLLADNKIGVFAISTYNTDYILTKKENFEDALRVLSDNGYIIKK
ncbi:ACT domain-containing protein [Eisenbergiella tayi]|uniref:ACT domain-containing protein n=1 Tax=Eisenbergiella tayi TaxID=1432052 RepID=UPI000E729498|nr:ACT domain-containing protein [Eisenbergiella tayi]MBS6817219.1 ACT domain-containing protein [Lachnospiraceae bacterium]MDT4532981.1 ACT domain-containing protein [Eisenbergiella tayi]RJW46596.1 ACT domain-containing protein [Lachnospiraceae bacterium OM02-31]RJW55400.1 ACT domain-containing protein [Lachnospiraceae bacterium OM02-3]